MRRATAFLTAKVTMIAAMLFAGCLLLASRNDMNGQETATRQRASHLVQDKSKATNSKIEPAIEAPSNAVANENAPKTIEEARFRAKLLHEAFSGALQVMHRDYFREDEKLKLPSKSLEDVFSEMARSQNVQLRWLAVNANAMSVNHQPQNDFEKEAVAALSSGKDDFESATAESFKYVGSIRLSASCVKCHVRSRTSNAERKAGLVITMPIEKKSQE